MNTQTQPIESTSFTVPPEQEIVSSRIIYTAPEAVFHAWTNPEILQKWWGPKGFTNTFHEYDLRPGCIWRFTMHGPEKGHYENECVFLTIEPPSLIAWQRRSQPLFRVVATFQPVTGGTLLCFHMQFPDKASCDKLKGFVPEKNEENFDRLEAVLQTL